MSAQDIRVRVDMPIAEEVYALADRRLLVTIGGHTDRDGTEHHHPTLRQGIAAHLRALAKEFEDQTCAYRLTMCRTSPQDGQSRV